MMANIFGATAYKTHTHKNFDTTFFLAFEGDKTISMEKRPDSFISLQVPKYREMWVFELFC